MPKLHQSQAIDGHSIEARLYAEDPEKGFLPSIGRIVALELPGDIRVDRGVEAGGDVTPYYDAMIAKLIVHEPTREAALARLSGALDRTLLAGPRNNVAFLGALCRADDFRRGRIDTGFIDRNLAPLGAVPHPPDRAAAALGVEHLLQVRRNRAADIDDDDGETGSPWAAHDGFQLGGKRAIAVPVVIDSENATATVTYSGDDMRVSIENATPAADARVFKFGDEAYVLRGGRQTRVRLKDFSSASAQSGGGDGSINAPMHGRVLEVLVEVGDQVTTGQRVAVIEAMKMEHMLRAPFAGAVTRISAEAGAQVVEGAEILVIEAAKAG